MIRRLSYSIINAWRQGKWVKVALLCIFLYNCNGITITITGISDLSRVWENSTIINESQYIYIYIYMLFVMNFMIQLLKPLNWNLEIFYSFDFIFQLLYYSIHCILIFYIYTYLLSTLSNSGPRWKSLFVSWAPWWNIVLIIIILTNCRKCFKYNIGLFDIM